MKRLIVDGYGKFISRRKNQIVVKERNRVRRYVLAEDLRQVVVTGQGGISFDAMKLLGEYGVDLIVVDWRGRITCRLSSALMRTVQTRRQQYVAYEDYRSGYLAKQFILAKMRNQYAVLGTLAKARRESSPEAAEMLLEARSRLADAVDEVEALKAEPVNRVRGRLMGLEGRASACYWDGVSSIFSDEYDFPGRTGRYASDPVNSMLNYGYALLEGEVWRAVHFAGLDPYGGFLHVDRPGRPSMVLDLMEEFRQQLVDKTVISLVTKHVIKLEDFSMRDGVCVLGDSSRRILLREVIGKFERYMRYRDRKVRWTDLILSQAVNVAKYLRGDVSKYEGFHLRW